MNGKKLLPLLVIASMMLSLLPSVMFANAAFTFTNFYAVTNGVEAGAPLGPPYSGVKGDVVAAKGTGATAGTTMSVFWDDSTINPFNGVKGFLNSTTVNSSGTFDLWFTIPEATNGAHYLWFKDSSGTAYGPYPTTVDGGFVVNARVKISASSGQPSDSITVNDYGYKGTKDLRIAFGPSMATWTATAVAAEAISATGTAVEYTGNLLHANIDPLVAVTVTPAPTSVTINYVTGAYDIVYAAAPGVAVNIAYSWFDAAATVGLSFLNAAVTNSVGSATTANTVPANTNGGWFFVSFDATGVHAEKAFTIGPVLTVTPAASTSGAIIHLLGRGFTQNAWISNLRLTDIGIIMTEATAGFTPAQCYVYNPSSGNITVDAGGRFTADIVVPQGNKVKDDYTITVTSKVHAVTTDVATASFQITAKSSVSLSPQFGPPGSSVTVSGTNYAMVSGTTVTVDLVPTVGPAVNLGTVKTLADGTFSKTFTVPAQPFGIYKISAYITSMSIQSSTSFTIGNLLLLLSKSSAPVGAKVIVSGTGFTFPGTYNITLGSKTLRSLGTVLSGGVISDTVQLPDMAPGVYTLTVYDKATSIPVTAQFTVTYTTSLTLTPSTFPSGFNISVTGQGFGYATGVVNPTFTLYNKTTSGTLWGIWTMNVMHGSPGAAAVVNGTGFIDGWWNFNGGALALGNGLYYVNSTDGTYKAQATFTIGNKVQSCVPRKTSFVPGETISFNIQYSFNTLTTSVIKIYDPSGNLYFSGDPLATWVASGDFYVVPYSAQTAGGNTMTLPDDAPLGTWTYKWISGTSTKASGSFTVVEAPINQLSDQVTALKTDVDGLKTSVAGIATNVNALSTAVQAASTTAASAATAAQAASTAAQAASTAAQAASTAATAAGTKADAATAAANAAKASADAAAAAANSLTTLVYGAIGASIVAALAAIVALMQISRKIA
jgi:uncharacterized protein YoxC